MYDIWCCLLLAALEADLSWEIPVEYTILRLLLRCLKTLKANTFWTRQKRCSFIGFPWKSHTVTSFVLYWSTGQPGRRYCSMGKCQAIQTGSKSFIIQCCKILISAYNDYLVLLNFKFGVCFEELFFFSFICLDHSLWFFNHSGKLSGKQKYSTSPGPQYNLWKKW